MRTNSIENTRSKNKKHKSYVKQKSKSVTDEIDEKESNILSSVDRIRAGNHLATTPVSPVGNIVDMQGSLDHGGTDKTEDESKINANKDTNVKNECGNASVDSQEGNKKQEDDKDTSREISSEVESVEVNSGPESVDTESKIISCEEAKNVEKEDTVVQKNTLDEAFESSTKSMSENQGTCNFLNFDINTINFYKHSFHILNIIMQVMRTKVSI